MAFMKTDVNYAVEFGQILDEIFPYESYYDDLWNQGEGMRYMPVAGKTFKIPSGTVSGARATNRDRIDGVFQRNMNNDWQTVDLQMDREWDTMVDPMDTQETGGVISVPNAARLFMTTQKIPEQDAFASAKIAEFAGNFGGVDTTTLTAANILAQWDAYLQYLTEQRVPRDQIRCKMTPAVYTLLKEAAGVTRFINVDGARDINRNIARLDGILIREVPSDMMQDAYDFTEGWVPAAGAHQINMILYSPLSIAAPVKYDVAMMGAPTAQSKGKALYYERYYYGMFALAQKQAGIFVNVGTAPSLGVLTVTSVAGTKASGDTVITIKGDRIFDSGRVPEGLELVYTAGGSAATSLTYGAALPGGVTWVKTPGTNPFTLESQTTGKYITVALVNKTKGVVVAGGNTAIVAKA
jgi:hypothetical protein